MFFIAYTFIEQVRVFAGQVKIVSHAFWALRLKTFPCSTQLSMKLILLIKVKMPTIVGILTFICMIIQHLRDLKQETSSFVGILVFMRS